MLRVFERKDVWIKRDKLMVLWFIFFLIIYIYDWFVYIVVEKKIWKKKFSRLKNWYCVCFGDDLCFVFIINYDYWFKMFDVKYWLIF